MCAGGGGAARGGVLQRVRARRAAPAAARAARARRAARRARAAAAPVRTPTPHTHALRHLRRHT